MKTTVIDAVGAIAVTLMMIGIAYLFCVATPEEHNAHNDIEMEVR